MTYHADDIAAVRATVTPTLLALALALSEITKPLDLNKRKNGK
jgi:hypothetical protein